MDQIVKLAIMAVGGQGGGVLTAWIVDLAERNGYAVQATSVAGVAQRTGATIYYVEMLPASDRLPVLALAPSEGDVDILIAAEMMEAGRAIMRGFVTPDRTTLIASSHRALSVSEKIVPGTGLADSDAVHRAASESAARIIVFDMEEMAQEAGSVISASLFGALAGSRALPFPDDSYRDTIRAAGRGVAASLRAFDCACAAAAATSDNAARTPLPDLSKPIVAHPDVPDTADGPATQVAAWNDLTLRLAAYPAPVAEVAHLGLRKLLDYQDIAYAADYLNRLDSLLQQDRAASGSDHEFAFASTAAKYLANAMTYDDLLRVADLKTRKGRMQRIAQEMQSTDATLVHVTEYLHPGAAEAISVMPRCLGLWVEARPRVVRGLDRIVNRGRRTRTDRLPSFLLLYAVGGLRRWRRSLLRHEREMAHIDDWIATASARLPTDYRHAVETLKIRRLIKGYSDTHSRGMSKFARVMAGAKLVSGRDDAADWTARLIAAALADAKGDALDGALATIRSFARQGGA
ncbi:indolepyruvate oxidoreductase subunit beta family protein [Loktanella sp. DJP18]|uniref:indolepyruvate oxidoreductase subunit beta family protein n=1 Tax=Loktanella sp. DJP18 TaxID=3409788 RepID=UPI003BB53A66